MTVQLGYSKFKTKFKVAQVYPLSPLGRGLIRMNAGGNFTTKTLKAFTMKEFAEMVKNLP